MPLITVEAMPGTLDIMQKDSLKGGLRAICADLFSVEGRELSWKSFSIVFPRLEKGSELTHDVVVRIRLNADPKRLLLAPVHALELYSEARDTIIGARLPHPEDCRVGISLDYGTEIVWCDENGVI